MNEPLVSVCMITFNHERYIRQAVESALNQKTDFDYEIVIGDDCSTDGTLKILDKLATEYPDRIRLLKRDTNLGVGRNVVSTYSECRGAYVAFLEGDDFWTDSSKLAKQVSALEKNPKATFSFHRVAYREDGRLTGIVHPAETQNDFSIEALFQANYVQTCSLVTRRSMMPSLPDWMNEHSILDWPICLLLRAKGEPVFLPEVMAQYRLHAAGVWTSASQITRMKRSAAFMVGLRKELDSQYLPLLRQLSARTCMERIYHCIVIENNEDLQPALLAHAAVASEMLGDKQLSEASEKILRAMADDLFQLALEKRRQESHLLIAREEQLRMIQQSWSWRMTSLLRDAKSYVRRKLKAVR